MKKNQTFPEKIWQFFCSTQLAIYTLVLLALTSIIGTIVLQNGSSDEYIQAYGHGLYNLIKILDFDDMYHAWWFLGLIMVLCINIIVCSVERLSVTWKIIFPEKITFNPDRFRKTKNKEVITLDKNISELTEKSKKLLARQIGKVLSEKTEKGVALYAEKGRWSRLGVYVVHTSLLFLMIGALIGAVFGFKANLNLDEGKSADTAIHQGNKNPIFLGFTIRCNDFNVKFYDTGAPEEYKSNLTIIENGKEVLTRDIFVNHPLSYKGINIFQSSYGAAPPQSATIEVTGANNQQPETIVIKIGEEILLSDGITIFKMEGSIPHFDFNGNDLGQAFIGRITEKNGKSYQIRLPLKFPTFDKMRKGSFTFAIKGIEQKHYTGLHITKDPGLWYVYAGFVLMIIGCWITFFISHESYFIEIQSIDEKSASVLITGTSNRNVHGLKSRIQKISKTIKGSSVL